MRLICIPLTLALGCSGQTVEEEGAAPGGKAPTTSVVKDAGEMTPPTAGDLSTVTGVQHLQTPSPKEMQVTLKRSKIEMPPPADRNFSYVEGQRDRLAVQTGVLLADLVLTVGSAATEKQVGYLKNLKASCEKLDVGTDIPGEIQTVIEEVESGSLAGPKLVQKFDELHGIMVPELEQEDADWLVPLVQAGSWLEGAHLVSKSFQGHAGDMTAAEDILLQPQVVRYFKTYVDQRAKDEGAPPAGVIKTLQKTLTTLGEVSGKSALSSEDITTIYTETGAVLDLLN